MKGVDKEGWSELVRLLKETEEAIAALSLGDFEKEIGRSRQSLKAFHLTAAKLGLSEAAKVGVQLTDFLCNQVNSQTSMDEVSAFGFAVSLLTDQVRDMERGKGNGSIDMTEIMEVINLPPMETASAPVPVEDKMPGSAPVKLEEKPKAKPAKPAETKVQSSDALNSSRLAGVVKSLGGELSITPNGKSGGKFSLTFSGSSESLQKLDSILAANESSESSFVLTDSKLEKILTRGKEFMAALSSGDMILAQEILLSLADQQQQAGLYKEIGGLARGLHDSIRTFISTMDPSIKEIVEDKIPDSGNRLEHMLQLTEKAAITTLDHTEAMQDRLETELESLRKIRQIFDGLKPIGDQAVRKMDEGAEIIKGLEKIVSMHHVDLDIILTAQDYQDLSGQIIQKIIVLLKELELKLVNMIRTFGVKVETGRKKEVDQLYGPAHEAREDTVHSQDEVDSLLAQFGF